MVSTRCLHRANLYRAICHSFKNFLYLASPVIDLTRFRQVFSCTSFDVLPSGAFRFIRCLIYKVHVPQPRNRHYLSTCLPSCQLLFYLFRHFSSTGFYSCAPPCRTALLDYHAWKHLSTANFVFCLLRIEPFLLSAPLMYYPRFPASKPYKNTSLAAGRA